MSIDPYSRNQPNLRFEQMFPVRTDGLCACGCGTALTGRQSRWASKACCDKSSTLFMIVKGHSNTIRRELKKRDKGVCATCGVQDTQGNWWEADHIVPVHRGGGGCDLDNYQTLCPPCHKAKTLRDSQLTKNSKAASLTRPA